MRISIGAEPQSLDPRKVRDSISTALMHMFFEGLTRFGKGGELEMALAESVEISEDGLEYRFRLRKSLWSNGSPVTAFDFAESWKTILIPGFRQISPLSSMTSKMRGKPNWERSLWNRWG